jgi:aspartyl-tRNA(Asn)/glutamyl-tRNA(Gln) amidotransferase subunit A
MPESADDQGVAGLLDAYRAGGSPVEVVDRLQRRIRNDRFNAFLAVPWDRALEEARASERRWHDGSQRQLEGVPFVAKDVIATNGVETTLGGALWRGHVPDRDAWVIARLRDAGAILTAKTNTNELACGDVSNPHFGPVPNPWDESRMAGGSSSGSAAAVAARSAPLALGTDSAGSVRIPAAFCNLTGLKPTHGLLSMEGISAVSPRLDCVGPIARSAVDVAIVMSVLAETSRPVVGDASRPLAGTRLGAPTKWSLEDCEDDVRRTHSNAIVELEALGAEVVEIDIPHVESAQPASWIFLHGDMPALWSGTPDRGPLVPNLARMDPKISVRLLTSLLIGGTDYALAELATRRVRDGLDDVFKTFTALVLPTSPTSALPLRAQATTIEGQVKSRFALSSRLTALANVAGLPAISVPCGFDSQGLPIGMQLIAAARDEATLLRIAIAYQAATSHHAQVPVGAGQS